MRLNNKQKVFLLILGFGGYHTSEKRRDSQDNAYSPDFSETFGSESLSFYKIDLLPPIFVNLKRQQYIQENYAKDFRLNEEDIQKIVVCLDAEQRCRQTITGLDTNFTDSELLFSRKEILIKLLNALK